MSKMANIRAKTKAMWQGMPIGKRIYAGLWLLTGIILMTLIGLFVGLKDSSSKTNPGSWAVTKVIVEPTTIKATDAADNIEHVGTFNNTWGLKTNDQIQAKNKVNGATVNLDTVTTISNAPSLYEIVNPVAKETTDKQGHVTPVDPAFTAITLKNGSKQVIDGYVNYTFGGYTAGTPTTSATMQQNAIAAMGGLFAVAITGAIFTTAGVEYMKRAHHKAKAATVGGEK